LRVDMRLLALARKRSEALEQIFVTAQVARTNRACGRVCAGKMPLSVANSRKDPDLHPYLGTPTGYLGSYKYSAFSIANPVARRSAK
jgi:hypothetical protein